MRGAEEVQGGGWRGRRGAAHDRQDGAAFGANLELLAGRQGRPVEREAGEQTIAVLPEIVDIARASRQFLVRVVRCLAADAGIRQFLDIGTGAGGLGTMRCVTV